MSNITIDTAVELRTLVFGMINGQLDTYNEAWCKQGFFFRDDERMQEIDVPSLGLGLVQNQGGSCGMLASVQASLLKHLLFADKSSKPTKEKMTKASRGELKRCLVEAVAEMIWRAAGGTGSALVARAGGPAAKAGGRRYAPDGLTECLRLSSFSSYNELRAFVRDGWTELYEPKGLGVALLLYSLVLTRGVDKVRSDMDDKGANLIGAHGYCTQEMVNLALTGQARSNVFNGERDMGEGMLIRGVTGRQEIGFLTLFEHYKYMEVGSHYKQPEHPIWVVFSESHYTCLWGLERNLVNEQEKFDLFYYDELANQDEEILLSVDNTDKSPAPRDDELEPPMNDVIRTKWPTARVDWNGSEPIL